MIKILLTTAYLSLGFSLIGAAPTLAGGFFIDNFNSSPSGETYSTFSTIQAFEPPQRLLTTSQAYSGSSEVSGLNGKETMGGTRNLSLNVNSIAGAPGDTPVSSRAEIISGESGGIFNFTANRGVGATATLYYAEQTNFFKTVTDKSAIALNVTSLTSKEASFHVTLMDRDGGMSTVTLTKDDYDRNENASLVFMLSQFKGINLNDIVAAELNVSQTADANSIGNIQIDSISGLEIPEPSVVIASIITGATGVFLKRRRHYQAK